MKRRILIGFIALIAVFGIASVLLSGAVVQSVAREQLSRQVAEENREITLRLKGRDPVLALGQVITVSRVTLIAPDGEVLFDNWTDQPLDNHMDRPEIRQAMSEGAGEATRFSETTKTMAVYAASRLPDGNILRVAAPERIAGAIAAGVAPWMIFGTVLVILITVLYANKLGDKLLKPILSIDLDRPEDAVVYDEVLPLIRRIDQQNRNTRAQMEALEARRLELNTLLDGMHEGFVALNDKEEVILLNPSAGSLLGIKPESAKGRFLREINRSPAMLTLLEDLRRDGTASGVLDVNGRHLFLLANRIQGQPGAVLLLSDQTDKMAAEAMRKRFTANVSHELRTPLTTISGYAELLDKGMVKAEDAGRFYSVIHHESNRMLTLVEDILRLSRLDEGYMGGRRELVNLREIAASACQSLAFLAEERNVSLSFSGEDAMVTGDRTLLHELCSNLVDNAIKYNVDKGSVSVKVQGGDQAVLRVSDTGIGIEAVHQPHVFERFYRTDKSRSKATGGTGLGLSIVKHAAEYHKAKITLHSQPGQGTDISVTFPPPQTAGAASPAPSPSVPGEGA